MTPEQRRGLSVREKKIWSDAFTLMFKDMWFRDTSIDDDRVEAARFADTVVVERRVSLGFGEGGND